MHSRFWHSLDVTFVSSAAGVVFPIPVAVVAVQGWTNAPVKKNSGTNFNICLWSAQHETAGRGSSRLVAGLQAYYVDIARSRSGEMIYISSASAITNETYWLPAHNPKAGLNLVMPRQQDVEYYIHHHPGTAAASARDEVQVKVEGPQGWFLITYRDQFKPNVELRIAPVADPTQQQVSSPPAT